MQENSQFWPSTSIQAPWARTTEIPRLIHYLEMKYKEERPADNFVSWQGVITPDTTAVLQNVTGSIREVAAKVMPAYLEWLGDKRAGEGGINICTTDFIDLHDFPSKVIRLNYK